jgi:hypothetical protein
MDYNTHGEVVEQILLVSMDKRMSAELRHAET